MNFFKETQKKFYLRDRESKESLQRLCSPASGAKSQKTSNPNTRERKKISPSHEKQQHPVIMSVTRWRKEETKQKKKKMVSRVSRQYGTRRIDPRNTSNDSRTISSLIATVPGRKNHQKKEKKKSLESSHPSQRNRNPEMRERKLLKSHEIRATKMLAVLDRSESAKNRKFRQSSYHALALLKPRSCEKMTVDFQLCRSLELSQPLD